MRQEVFSAAGAPLVVTTTNGSDRYQITLDLKTAADAVLHWGVAPRPGAAWRCPPRDWWPEGTVPVDAAAVRTPFARGAGQEGKLTIPLAELPPRGGLAFVLHLPRENRWVKNGTSDFYVELPRGDKAPPPPEEALRRWAPEAGSCQVFPLHSGDRVAAGVRAGAERLRVTLVTDAEAPVLLHWGVAEKRRHEWKLPPEETWPAGTTPFDDQAVQTPLVEREGLRWLELTFRRPQAGAGPRGLHGVLFQPATGTWLKTAGGDLFVPLFQEAAVDSRLPGQLLELADEIIEAETGRNSWTLMHRFQLAHDLLGRAQDDPEALALLFAWLRYSAIRQLDWQRNYNTKPRELAHAQDRLTQRLAAVWHKHPAGSPGRGWARLTLTTLGRGGDGQRVRDEILHIMHRNHLKEVAHTFIEEWHQKLHNNTTPDDVAICEAYLAFLTSGGRTEQFYRTLEQGGVTRARLQGFERPIRSDPHYYPDRKDALVRDFENFLRILKSVHAGTDLETAAAAARGRLDAAGQQQLDQLLGSRHRLGGLDLTRAVVGLRRTLAARLGQAGDDASRRDLLFLDLALEETLRGAIERQDLSRLGRDDLLEFVRTALENVCLSLGGDEITCCARHWNALLAMPRTSTDWALQAQAALERTARWVQGFTDALHHSLQPRAEALGEAFGVDSWVVPLFSEEIIRGGPVFALSRLLRCLDPLLRKAAGLGGWQIVSPGQVQGRVRRTARLLPLQAERFAEPTVLVSDEVSGEEEIPEGVTAVLTTAMPDLVSHVAVRARNARVLMATCYDQGKFAQLQQWEGRLVTLRVTPSGDVEVTESSGAAAAPAAEARPARPLALPARLPSERWVLTAAEFTRDLVGGKSLNLQGLRGRLADGIELPRSLALPFGVFERVLADAANRAVAAAYEALLAQVTEAPEQHLPRVRELVLGLQVPPALQAAVQDAWRQTGLPEVPWEKAWRSILRVWASKWNERAYFSRRARGVPHEHLVMAVLVQQVVPADYAFVLHTANPLSGSRDEVFGEVVLGLGETLVGNYPGRALGFLCRKANLELRLVSYPSKNIGLFGTGVIFRSDSNGEDLEGFAGAGLYDSFLAVEPQARTLDYAQERLVGDPGFREELLRTLARIGIAVEQQLGAPQDIEGAVAHGRYHVVQTRPQVGLD